MKTNGIAMGCWFDRFMTMLVIIVYSLMVMMDITALPSFICAV